MGIQGLARRLEPYASRYSLQEVEGFSAIIDGPALAYYAHKLALADSATQTRIPSYTDIIATAIRWLNSLEDMNIKVSAVLFDGALPQSKRAERLSRLEQNNKRVQQLRACYPTTACPIPTYLGSNSYAFLAPALKEALIESSFASRTRVVPGEADDWCALHASQNERCIIFTSDTDLILYQYPPETLVVFLHNADLTSGLRAYSPDRIKQKLQLNNLVAFAFSITQGPSDTTSDLLRKTQNVDLESDEYITFGKRYTAEVVVPVYLSRPRYASSNLQDLDVRVSEFVHQTLDDSSSLLIYLPLLVEDPNQASAWNMGLDIRMMAYSLLTPQNAVIREYKRKAQGISIHEFNSYSTTNVRVPAVDLGQRISALMEWASSKPIDIDLLWPLFAFSLVLADLNTPPSVILVLRVLNGDFDNTWAFIQLTARIQAALYSLRIFKQIIGTWLEITEKKDVKLFECLCSINEQMKNFPSIAEMFTIPGQQGRVLAGHEELKALVEEIYVSAGVELPTEQVSNKKKKRQAREADRKQRKAEQRQKPRSQIANAFTSLSTE
ncbi:Nn.00g090120.m01.CDS01 [Neocucurbitaria sp. VM-36]